MIHSIILFISLPAPPLPSLSPLYQSIPWFTPSFYVYLSLSPPIQSLPRFSPSFYVYLPCPSSSFPLSISILPPLIHHSMYICPSLSPIYQSLPWFTPSFYVYHSLSPPLPSLSSLYQSLPWFTPSYLSLPPLSSPMCSFPLLSISILSMIHSIVLPSPLYINPFRDSLHHSMYITPCPLLFLASPLYSLPWFTPIILCISSFPVHLK